MDRGGHIVLGNMLRRGFSRIVIQDILRQASRQESGHVVSIVGVSARLKMLNRDSALGVRTRHIRRKI